MGERRLFEPFFHDELALAVKNPFALLFRRKTDIEALGQWRRVRPGLRPSGFIFHMSRCGSTLISQLLATSSDAVVLSEPPALDSLLRGGTDVPEHQRAIWLEWLMSALGQPRAGNETRCFIKLDCWHIRYWPILRQAYPEVPWIFLYRDPLEVLASHQDIPALWSIPGYLDPSWIGADPDEVIQIGRVEYCARMLANICESALEFHERSPMGRLVSYDELPEAVWTSLARHFAVEFNDAEIAAMRRRSELNSKTPGLNFVSDRESKRADVSLPASQAAQRWLNPIYARLELARGFTKLNQCDKTSPASSSNSLAL